MSVITSTSDAMGTASTQMNVRIARGLKQEGDYALSQAGFSPSDAVRALWRRAVGLREEPETLREILDPPTETPLDADAETNPKTAALESIRSLEASARSRLSIKSDESFLTGSYPEMRDAYLAERLELKDGPHA